MSCQGRRHCNQVCIWSRCRANGSKHWGHDIYLSGSCDVSHRSPGHVTIRFPIGHFLFASSDCFSVRLACNRNCIWCYLVYGCVLSTVLLKRIIIIIITTIHTLRRTDRQTDRLTQHCSYIATVSMVS